MHFTLHWFYGTYASLTLNGAPKFKGETGIPKDIMTFFFFNCYLAVPRPALGHFRGDSLPNPMLITAFLLIQPEGHREPRNEVVGSSPVAVIWSVS